MDCLVLYCIVMYMMSFYVTASADRSNVHGIRC